MPPAVEGTTDESDAWAMSPCFPTRLHAQAGAILGLHPRLHAGARPAAGRSRFATILPGDAAFSPPDGAHARTQRPDPPSARHRPSFKHSFHARVRAKGPLFVEFPGFSPRPEPSGDVKECSHTVYRLRLKKSLPWRVTGAGVARHVERPRARLRRRSEAHTSELQSQFHLVCRLLLEKKKKKKKQKKKKRKKKKKKKKKNKKKKK